MPLDRKRAVHEYLTQFASRDTRSQRVGLHLHLPKSLRGRRIFMHKADRTTRLVLADTERGMELVEIVGRNDKRYFRHE